MGIKETNNVFDFLACLCSFLSKEKERECAMRWATATAKEVKTVLEKYKNVIASVLNASAREYKFNKGEILQINACLQMLEAGLTQSEAVYDEIYLLAIQVEERIDNYSGWMGRGVIFEIEPLNSNYEESGVSVYPYYPPEWDTTKSERMRDNTFNAKFKNYLIIRSGDASPFEIVMHYWNDTGLLHKQEDGWYLKAALCPLTDHARLNVRKGDGKTGRTDIVEGVQNEEEMQQLKPECDFRCSDDICYFDVTISYEKHKFSIKFQHCMCA